MTKHSISNSLSRIGKHRAGMMASVAILALLGAGLATESFMTSAPANAAASTQSATVATFPSFADVVSRVRPAVVSVKVKVEQVAAGAEDGEQFQMPDLPPGHPLEKFFRQFGEQGQKGRKPNQFGMSQGSGFFISADGYIVTNNHVVDNAVEVSLSTDDGQTLDATVIGKDAKTDLALLKVKQAGAYPFVEFAGDAPRVGDWVVAVGNPFGLGGTVTAGIVSARGRDIGAGPYDDFIQIDAAVNKGNSGGPTFNLNGDVVGVNTAIYSPSGGNVGIAFAVPSETVKTVIAALKENGSVERGYLGVQIQPVTQDIADSLALKDTKGALVAEIQPDTPAFEAGIKAGDVILSVNGDVMAGPKEVTKRISQIKPGDTVKVTLMRDGKEQTLNVRLGLLPEKKTAALDDTSPKAPATFGLALAPTKDGVGVMVTDIDPNGIAAEKGISKGDLILEIGGKTVTKPSDVRASIDAARKDGRKAVMLRLKSDEGTRFIALAFPKA